MNNIPVTLEIQGTSIQCNRLDLIKHSDYFKAMFTGSFVESDQNAVKLNGVEVDAINIILKLLLGQEIPIDEEDVLSVLQASCMLQFLEIQEKCIHRIEELLNVKNCLKFWLYTEQLSLDVNLKAKMMALMEFMSVINYSTFLEMDFNEVLGYLSNVYLQCNQEIYAFRAAIKWYENSGEKDEERLLQLLHCLDFTRMTESEINEISFNKYVNEIPHVIDVLKCICSIKLDDDISTFPEDTVEKASVMLDHKHRRSLYGFPCIFMNSMKINQQEDCKEDVVTYYYDKHKRKRKFRLLQHEDANVPKFSVVYVDVKTLKLKKLFSIDSWKCEDLDGFKIIGYKNFVYLIGGEFLLGQGDWNYNLHMYDVLQEQWKQKLLFPYSRRHFEAYIGGNKLFIVGGTGPFRVIQENMFWYNFDTEMWSEEHKLPCSGRQIKCCAYSDKLFILDINNRCGFLFNPDNKEWSRIEICDDENTLPSYSEGVSLFSYRDNIYIKEQRLYELKFRDMFLVNEKQHSLSDLTNDVCRVESILCGNKLYSLNEHICEETCERNITLDILDMDSFQSVRVNFNMIIDDESFQFNSSLIIFNVFHHHLLNEKDTDNNFAK